MIDLENKNYVDITKESPVIISFCPGIRGLERGLERVFHSIRVAAYVEIETFIVENLLAARIYDKLRRLFGRKCHDCRSHSHCNDYGCVRTDKTYPKQWWMKY